MDITQVRTTQFHDGSTDDIFALTHDPLPDMQEGDVRIRMDTISLDPAMRGWTTNVKSYMPPVQPGDIMRCFGVAEVLESNSKYFQAGDWVTGFLGVQTHGILNQRELRKIDLTYGEPKDFLSGLGMTGYTAYFGMTDIGKPKKGDTVVVSAASGAVGSVASQIAKLAGAYVVGIAGGPEKCAFLKGTLKLDGVIDYKNEDIYEALKRECPKGIDVYFDNVGGQTLEAAISLANYQSQIVICGAISQYGDFSAIQGPANFLKVISSSLKIQGFTMKDYFHLIPEALKYLIAAKQEGKIVFREHMLEGIENFGEAMKMVYAGKNHGKLLLKVAK
ncbi:NADP-dependent oxidoreductase [Temperatibacter marinus]|uniref:NADP-dependent oxidoreductase n=1 Tax=Temperatibacter marinus TaxID=1456591 RepID=A0AA52HAV1_9PROT|nr:NADP-dependent oxidoreductase [Temperatibacter marinus]WND02993.1 NADP-dependent oxidoreductase [Temperatibacter marinus]